MENIEKKSQIPQFLRASTAVKGKRSLGNSNSFHASSPKVTKKMKMVLRRRILPAYQDGVADGGSTGAGDDDQGTSAADGEAGKCADGSFYMKELAKSMAILKTNNEVTKRCLLIVDYMNRHSEAKEFTLHAATGDLTIKKLNNLK